MPRAAEAAMLAPPALERRMSDRRRGARRQSAERIARVQSNRIRGIAPDWRWLAAGFVLFRFFDIVKPWPIREADHSLSGGLGIMLDDIIAGIFAAAILLATKLFI